MTFTKDTRVLTIFDRKENPWRECGTVLIPSQEIGFTWVQWPENILPAKEEDWTLVETHNITRAPNPDAADLAADRAGF